MSRVLLRTLVGIALLGSLLLLPGTASAHTTIIVGKYAIEIGWVNEPPIAGQPNDVVVNVAGAPVEGSTPVAGAAPAIAPDSIDISKLIVTAEYGGQSKQLTIQPLGEDTPTEPASPYAASKLAAEAVALQAWRGFGQPVVVVRPFNHIGPGQSPNFFVPALAKRIVEARRSGARSLSVGNLTTRRDFTDVRDVVAAYRLLVERGVSGTVYNVCSGRDVAMSDLAAQLLELAGAELTLQTDPALLRPVDVPVLRGSAGRLTAATGWEPRIPLATTLADVLTSWEAD